MSNPRRKMPDRVWLGQMVNGPISSATRWQDRIYDGRPMFPEADKKGLRRVLGMVLPPWQRGFVWTEAQNIAFIQSMWLGLPIGTYALNLNPDSEFDGYLIDGQQRMRALELYLQDAFPVFGHKYSEITEVDGRFLDGIVWPYYETRSNDEQWLRDYYNRMNFGGTAHNTEDRA